MSIKKCKKTEKIHKKRLKKVNKDKKCRYKGYFMYIFFGRLNFDVGIQDVLEFFIRYFSFSNYHFQPT